METPLTTICIIWLCSLAIISDCEIEQVSDNDIDCTFNCTCCKNQECGNGTWYENECKQGCIAGYRGARCYEKCIHDCVKCDTSIHKCSECSTGMYGSDCTKNCSVGCVNNTCSLMDGICRCRDNFWGTFCDNCQRGRYGALCNYQCSIGCKNYQCDKTSGDCTNGCILDTIIGKKCDRCVDGVYGKLCHKKCSKGCKNGICKKANGDCPLRCLDGFNGSRCDQSKDEVFPTRCGLETDDQHCSNPSKESSKIIQINSTTVVQYVMLGILGTVLAVSVISKILFVMIHKKIITSRRESKHLKEPTQKENSVYSDLQHNQVSENPYCAVTSGNESGP